MSDTQKSHLKSIAYILKDTIDLEVIRQLFLNSEIG